VDDEGGAWTFFEALPLGTTGGSSNAGTASVGAAGSPKVADGGWVAGATIAAAGSIAPGVEETPRIGPRRIPTRPATATAETAATVGQIARRRGPDAGNDRT
jgi:hypothetical protein